MGLQGPSGEQLLEGKSVIAVDRSGQHALRLGSEPAGNDVVVASLIVFAPIVFTLLRRIQIASSRRQQFIKSWSCADILSDGEATATQQPRIVAIAGFPRG